MSAVVLLLCHACITGVAGVLQLATAIEMWRERHVVLKVIAVSCCALGGLCLGVSLKLVALLLRALWRWIV